MHLHHFVGSFQVFRKVLGHQNLWLFFSIPIVLRLEHIHFTKLHFVKYIAQFAFNEFDFLVIRTQAMNIQRDGCAN